MGKDADLKVNVELLVSSETTLSELHKEFKDLGKNTDDMRPYWGSGKITDAMDEFVDNWDDYRGKMLDKIDAVQKAVKATIDGFDGFEAELAKGLRGDKKK